jgi:hypothetical protein
MPKSNNMYNNHKNRLLIYWETLKSKLKYLKFNTQRGINNLTLVELITEFEWSLMTP